MARPSVVTPDAPPPAAPADPFLSAQSFSLPTGELWAYLFTYSVPEYVDQHYQAMVVQHWAMATSSPWPFALPLTIRFPEIVIRDRADYVAWLQNRAFAAGSYARTYVFADDVEAGRVAPFSGAPGGYTCNILTDAGERCGSTLMQMSIGPGRGTHMYRMYQLLAALEVESETFTYSAPLAASTSFTPHTLLSNGADSPTHIPKVGMRQYVELLAFDDPPTPQNVPDDGRGANLGGKPPG